MCYLVPGPLPCPEVVAVFYIRPAEVPTTLFSVEGDAQVEQQNTVVGFLTSRVGREAPNIGGSMYTNRLGHKGAKLKGSVHVNGASGAG